jgi:hypothetical protein
LMIRIGYGQSPIATGHGSIFRRAGINPAMTGDSGTIETGTPHSGRYRRSPSVTSRCQIYSPDAISTAIPSRLQTSGHSPQIAIPSTLA